MYNQTRPQNCTKSQVTTEIKKNVCATLVQTYMLQCSYIYFVKIKVTSAVQYKDIGGSEVVCAAILTQDRAMAHVFREHPAGKHIQLAGTTLESLASPRRQPESRRAVISSPGIAANRGRDLTCFMREKNGCTIRYSKNNPFCIFKQLIRCINQGLNYISLLNFISLKSSLQNHFKLFSLCDIYRK